MTPLPKIAFSDIDGTLLDKNRRVSVATRHEVSRLTQLDIPFILISSRMPRAMTHLQADLGITGQPLIAYNGGLVIANERVLLSQAIDLDVVRTVAELSSQVDFSTSLYYEDEWVVPALDYYANRETSNTRTQPTIRALAETISAWGEAGHGAHKIMCMGEPASLGRVVDTLNRQYPDALHLYRSKDDYLEIADARISKLIGVECLLKARFPTLSLGNCIAFGDNYNDIDMLQGVGIGVAVGNARAEVKAVADAVVAGNKEYGVAEGLRRYFTD